MIILHEVTIKDVARVAGVSMSTVNKALTGKTGISAELKKRVLDTVEKLNYQPNKAAGAIARNRVHIGIVIPDNWENSCYDIVQGIEHRMNILADWNFASKTMTYSVHDSDTDKNVLDCLKKLHEKKIKSFILCKSGNHSYEKSIEYAVKNDIKVVCIGYSHPSYNSNFLTIDSDAYKCGQIAAELFEFALTPGEGAAIITGNKNFWTNREKIRGFVEKSEQKKSITCFSISLDSDNNEESYKVAKELLSKNVSAIYISLRSIDGICKAINESGKKVKLITTDILDEYKKYFENDMITATIYQNTFLQGSAAANAFYDFFIFGDTPPDVILISPVIITKEGLMPDYRPDIHTYLG